MGNEVATQAVVPFNQLQQMATSVAKSGMFAVKTPEGALTLMLIAQAEGIHPAQAMMDYDIIPPNGGKPCLKSAAMLARFQRAGGKVRWITSNDDVAEAEFSHASGGTLTVKWDHARLVKAGLDGKDMHKKFPAQMKRARCISEGIRAIAPQCIPVGMYAVEEVQDMDNVIDGTAHVVSTTDAVNATLQGPDAQERAALDKAISSATDIPALSAAFAAAWERAKAVGDRPLADTFRATYEARKVQLTQPVAEVM